MSRSLSAALGGAVLSSIALSVSTAAHAENAGSQPSTPLPPVIVKQAAPKPANRQSLQKKKPAPEQPASAPAREGEGSGQVAISPSLRPTPLSQLGSSVTVITGQDLEAKQNRTVPDALSGVPGLNVVQAGGSGGITSVFIRGTDANHTKVLIDGIDVSDPSSPDGAFDFAHLLTSGIGRIEILRGAQSGLYGSDAIGGVIDIRTVPGSGPAQVTGSVEALPRPSTRPLASAALPAHSATRSTRRIFMPGMCRLRRWNCWRQERRATTTLTTIKPMRAGLAFRSARRSTWA